jgi:hypothetical protein
MDASVRKDERAIVPATAKPSISETTSASLHLLARQVFPPLTPLQFDASVKRAKGSANYSDSATEEEEIYCGARSVTGYCNVDQRSIEPNIPSI